MTEMFIGGVGILYALATAFWLGFRSGRAGERFVRRLDDQERDWQRYDWLEKLERRRKLRARFEGRSPAA